MRVRNIVIGVLLLACGSAFSQSWWNKEWRYRMPVTVDAGMQDRADYLVRLPLDLKALAQAANLKQPIAPDSFRVVEVETADGKPAETASLFKKGEGFSAGVKEEGSLVWVMKGKTAALGQRSYQVYFDSTVKAAANYEAIPGADEEVGVNLVPNGGFEDVDAANQATGWQKANRDRPLVTTGTVDVTDKEAHSGKRSLHFSKPKADGLSCFYCCGSWTPVPPNPIKVKPNRKYQLSGWTKAAGTDGQSMQFGFTDDKWVSLTAYNYSTAVDFAAGTHDWTQAKCVLTSPPGSYYAFIRLYAGSGAGDAYFDDITLVELPSVEPAKVVAGKPEGSN